MHKKYKQETEGHCALIKHDTIMTTMMTIIINIIRIGGIINKPIQVGCLVNFFPFLHRSE